DVASRGRRRAMDIRVAVAVPALAEDAPRSGLARRGALSCGDRRLPPGRLRARHLVAMAALPTEAEEGIGRLRKDVTGRGTRIAMDIRAAMAVPALAEDAPRSGLARRGAPRCGDRRLPPGRLGARRLLRGTWTPRGRVP